MTRVEKWKHNKLKHGSKVIDLTKGVTDEFLNKNRFHRSQFEKH